MKAFKMNNLPPKNPPNSLVILPVQDGASGAKAPWKGSRAVIARDL